MTTYYFGDTPDKPSVTGGAVQAEGGETPAASAEHPTAPDTAPEAAAVSAGEQPDAPLADEGGERDGEPEDTGRQDARPARAGWFAVAHDDVRAILDASDDRTAGRNLATWILLTKTANVKGTTEFCVSCAVLGADLRGVDRRAVRESLLVLRECGLLDMSEPEKNKATGRYFPTAIRLLAKCSSVRNVKKQTRKQESPCTPTVHGDSDTATLTVLKRSSLKRLPKSVSLEETTKENSEKSCSVRGIAGANAGGRLAGLPPRRPASSAWNGKKKTATHGTTTETSTTQLKAANYE